MAHTKSVGSTKLGRDSNPKNLGVKINDGQMAMPGQIILRQRGTRYWPGHNVRQGADDTLYAGIGGLVKFTSKRKTKFDGTTRDMKVISVVPKL